MFSTEVKLDRKEWEKIKKDFNELNQENIDLNKIIKRQSSEIKKRIKYEDKDDLLFSYEKTNEKNKSKIILLKSENQKKDDEIILLKRKLKAEELLSSLYIKKLAESNISFCKELELVTINDLKEN